jgi:hypothetical protein
VSPTITILAAGLLTAQTPHPALNFGKPCDCQKGGANGHIQPVAATSSSPGLFRGLFRTSSDPVPVVTERSTILSRIQGFFGKKSEVETVEPAPIVMQQQVDPSQPGPFRLMQRLPAGPQPSGNNLGVPITPAPLPAAPAKVLLPISYQGVPPSEASDVLNAGATQSSVVPSTGPSRISQDLIGKVGHETDYSWITGQLRVENGSYVIHYAAPDVVDAHHGSVVLTSEREIRGFQDGDFVSIRGSLAGRANGRTLYRVTHMDRLPR